MKEVEIYEKVCADYLSSLGTREGVEEVAVELYVLLHKERVKNFHLQQKCERLEIGGKTLFSQLQRSTRDKAELRRANLNTASQCQHIAHDLAELSEDYCVLEKKCSVLEWQVKKLSERVKAAYGTGIA